MAEEEADLALAAIREALADPSEARVSTEPADSGAQTPPAGGEPGLPAGPYPGAPWGQATPAEVQMLSDTCVRAGLTAGRLALQTGAEMEPAAAQVCEAAGLQLRPGLVRAFEELVRVAAGMEPLAKRARGEEGPRLEPVAIAEAAEGLLALGRREQPAAEPFALRPPRGQLDRLRRPRAAGAEGPGARGRADDDSRKRSLALLVSLLSEADTPSYQAAQSCMGPRRALESVAGTARASTMRSYLRTWSRWRRWCLRVYRLPWPARVCHVLDYLHERVDEPCGP